MGPPDKFDRWMQRWGWRLVVVAMVLAACMRAWSMWHQTH